MTETKPECVTTNEHVSYPSTIEQEFGKNVLHRTNTHLNNLIEHDHRGIEQRCRLTRGFYAFNSAASFCRPLDELSNFY